MRLTILSDNQALDDRHLIAEPGWSIYIQEGGKNILFDLGYSDAFMQNAGKLDINLLDLDYIVLSHGHADHTWGLIPLIRLYTEADSAAVIHKRPDLVAHPDAFYLKITNRIPQAGPRLSIEELSHYLTLRLSREPLWLTDNVVFLGEIERKYPVYSEERKKREILAEEGVQPDLLLDDTALACKTRGGLVIVTGCSHSGIMNIIEYARQVCNEKRILDVIGGLHLLNPREEQLNATLRYFEEVQPEHLHASHCTDLPSKIALSSVAPLEESGVGLQIEYT